MSERVIDILISSFPRIFGQGILVTIPLTVISFALALVIAVLCAMVQIADIKGLKQLVRFYIWIIRGTPLLVQLYLVYFGLPDLGIMLPAFPCAVAVFALNEGAYCAETVRASIEAVPKGQMEAGWSSTPRRSLTPTRNRSTTMSRAITSWTATGRCISRGSASRSLRATSNAGRTRCRSSSSSSKRCSRPRS